MRPIPEKVDFPAKGARLTGYYYPAQSRVRANLVLHGATGVPQQFYRILPRGRQKMASDF